MRPCVGRSFLLSSPGRDRGSSPKPAGFRSRVDSPTSQGSSETRSIDLMKVVVNELEGCRRGLEVEIPGDQVLQEFERSFREYSLKALEEKKLDPVDSPVLDEVKYEDGRPLTFKATFEVRPILTVSDYRNIQVEITPRRVTDEMVDASVRDLADRAAKLEQVTDRPVQKGDFIVGTLSCRFLKGKGKNLTDEPLFLEAGSENNHPDFNASILGALAGDKRSF